ncbi:MAG: YCF48-related protein, partial [Lentimicrobiaceae bacterium]|nr:YCF48-related protein [Lentimicrobiaceae bacterium]
MIRKTLLFVMLVGISVFKVNAQSTWFPLQSGTDKTLYGVDFFNENTGIAVGNKGIILKTTDGGATWEQKDAGVGVALNSVSFIDKYHAIIVGNGGLMLKTEDGGNTWTQEYIQNISEADLLSIDMEPSGKGIVCGRYMTILTTQDMGTTWLVLRKNYIGAFYSARILNNNIAFVFGENSISNSFVMAIAHY